ncbi:1-deoxy-D-xylulose-5-phosphate reductoisomerase [Sporosarcina pasteurii]|uniref:1-deoxy-D-xylulose 5-phosphate reductoisomerase n=1 Tax=Sporosarcina pasteurii TaxID=1474 RepID=A0A380BIK8_SPOPA|nr:1-deoxy-D-xylulose-5-phosphate reductoisomerase [Sporosarcina pasteurii]MDS9470615.1 1-deoxy-D-xylulose-5-phosphate reductoisomerase [Sporosarcina pasteurii]QBQ05698.1 1-deoxy-D-xylulose-5-phosphate reductoisomerase [Sporosarcina pasteurii]SUJ01151.1 1-deoxy-D-xylulose 5-phosphate reductoisomerase [Sporosarcina pasteurii]
MKKKISLLGATGSIGVQTLDILKSNPNTFELVSFSAGLNIDKVREIASTFQPNMVSVIRQEDAKVLQSEFPRITFVYGAEGLREVAACTGADILVNAVIGSVGLGPTLEAIRAGITIAIANKETLVAAGEIVMDEARKFNVPLLPVDSEHSALFQSLNGENPKEITKLILTASGGSFRDVTRDELSNVTVEEALAHPNWSMGSKLTIDSATMMNKGLEVIEAHHLFNIPYEQIDVLLHRESIIHSMVEFHDTSVMAQLGSTDMRVPIQYALTYPHRIPMQNAKRLRLEEIGQLHFEKIDFKRFKALALAYEAGKAGGTMPTAMNAANEIAVSLFMKGHIPFLEIDEIVERVMDEHKTIVKPTLEAILEVDRNTRNTVYAMVQ